MNIPLTRAALELAMSNNELVLHYQPKVCLLRGDVIGAEALVRWSDGINGVVSPDEFLPFVEESGLLHDLTLNLLDQVVEASGSLRQNPATDNVSFGIEGVSNALSLSINVAPDDLASRTISNRISELLSNDTIIASDLQIEITESAVMGNVDRVYDDLLRLKTMGIKILMDDFGTGYSSIDRLSQLPFDALKLDQGVVKRMATSRQNLDVVRAAISMARELGMNSVAEGVESAPVYNFLTAHGCEEAQGYYIGRPMSLTDFQTFISEPHEFEGSQIGRVHQACLNLMRFRKALIDAAFCARIGEGIAPQSVVDPREAVDIYKSRLGLWYYGMGQHLSAYPAYTAMEKPLNDVHSGGLLFLEQLSQGVPIDRLDTSLAALDEQVEELIRQLHDLERLLLSPAAVQ